MTAVDVSGPKSGIVKAPMTINHVGCSGFNKCRVIGAKSPTLKDACTYCEPSFLSLPLAIMMDYQYNLQILGNRVLQLMGSSALCDLV